MKTAKLAVAAVTCLVAACSGDPEQNNTNGSPNNSNNLSNTSGSNNVTTANNESNATNNPTNSSNNTTGPNNSNNSTGSNNSNNTIPMPSGAALAVSADFASGSSAWHAADLADQSASDNVFGSGDVGAAWGDQWGFVLDRNGAQVQVLDTELADLGVIDVSGVGTTNPNDATDANGKAYISLYNTGELAIATPNGSDWDQTRLDLSSFEDGSNPEPSAMLTDEGYVLVVLQRLDENFVGVEPSLLLVVDSNDDTMVDIDLSATNAQAGLRAFGANFAVGVTGDYGVNDGGILTIERNAAGDYSAGELLVNEEELGGDLIDFVFVDEDHGFAVVTLPDFSSQLLRFDLADEEVAEVTAVVSPGFGGLDVSDDGGWLAVGERETGNEAFLLFDLSDPDFGSHFELPVTLPPAGFVFVP